MAIGLREGGVDCFAQESRKRGNLMAYRVLSGIIGVLAFIVYAAAAYLGAANSALVISGFLLSILLMAYGFTGGKYLSKIFPILAEKATDKTEL